MAARLMFAVTIGLALLGLTPGGSRFRCEGWCCITPAAAEQVPVVEDVESEDSPAAEAAGENAGAQVPAPEAIPQDAGPPPADQPPPVQQPPVEP